MILNMPGGNSIRKTFFEFVLIIVGVLVALAVNQWQEDRKEKQFLTQQLESIVSEIDANLITIKIIRENTIPRKLKALERVISTLNSAGINISNVDDFIRELAVSSVGSTVWFTRNRYDALRSSGSFRIIGDREIEDDLSDTFDGMDVLFSQATTLEAGYPALVHQLIPASYQSELNILSYYVAEGTDAPGIEDNQAQNETVNVILGERGQLVRLARAEVAVATGKWYALTRIKAQFEELKTRLLAHPALKDSDFNKQAL